MVNGLDYSTLAADDWHHLETLPIDELSCRVMQEIQNTGDKGGSADE